MLFNSFHFLCFFPLVVCAYFTIPYKYRWGLLLSASYYFYLCWKLEYIVLILASTLVDYYAGIQMGKTRDRAKKKLFLLLSLFVNMGILFGFKYFNFVNDSLRELCNQFNILYTIPEFEVLLPVGISFYTFQTVSYSIDVYRGKMQPEKHLGIFALYVAFFPQLVAGPIERAKNLLPQLRKNNTFDYARGVLGLRLMLWGFFKKIVIADRLAQYVDAVHNGYAHHTSLTILIASLFFSIQVYCDFSGYSDIAIGAAKIMGYDLKINFKRPFFASSMSEFWSRWHISLSSWFRDYVYIPLGGRRVPRWRWFTNILIVFFLSGLWHGAGWTFILFGLVHGIYLIIGVLTRDMRSRVATVFRINVHSLWLRFYNIIITFMLFSASLVFFRARSVRDAVMMFKKMLAFEGGLFNAHPFSMTYALLGIFILLVTEIQQEFFKKACWGMNSKTLIVRQGTYIFLIISIVAIGVLDARQFIYFQF